MVVTTIALKEDVHQRLKIAAVKDRLALTELVRRVIEKWLHERERSGR